MKVYCFATGEEMELPVPPPAASRYFAENGDHIVEQPDAKVLWRWRYRPDGALIRFVMLVPAPPPLAWALGRVFIPENLRELEAVPLPPKPKEPEPEPETKGE